MEAISMLLAFVAGLFSVLSPCVLPLVPIVLGAAVAEHKLGPVALAVGLALSFTAIGMFVATIGYTIGLDGDVFRSVAAVLLVSNWPRSSSAVPIPPSRWIRRPLRRDIRSGKSSPIFCSCSPSVCIRA